MPLLSCVTGAWFVSTFYITVPPSFFQPTANQEQREKLDRKSIYLSTTLAGWCTILFCLLIFFLWIPCPLFFFSSRLVWIWTSVFPKRLSIDWKRFSVFERFDSWSDEHTESKMKNYVAQGNFGPIHNLELDSLMTKLLNLFPQIRFLFQFDGMRIVYIFIYTSVKKNT